MDAREQLSHVRCLPRQSQVRYNVRQRPQDKFSPAHSGMGQLQIITCAAFFAEIKEIEVERPRDIMRMNATTTERLFDSLQSMQEHVG